MSVLRKFENAAERLKNLIQQISALNPKPNRQEGYDRIKAAVKIIGPIVEDGNTFAIDTFGLPYIYFETRKGYKKEGWFRIPLDNITPGKNAPLLF